MQRRNERGSRAADDERTLARRLERLEAEIAPPSDEAGVYDRGRVHRLGQTQQNYRGAGARETVASVAASGRSMKTARSTTELTANTRGKTTKLSRRLQPLTSITPDRHVEKALEVVQKLTPK